MKLTERVELLEQQNSDMVRQLNDMRMILSKVPKHDAKKEVKISDIDFSNRVYEELIRQKELGHPLVADRDLFSTRQLYQVISELFDEDDHKLGVHGFDTPLKFLNAAYRKMSVRLCSTDKFTSRKAQWYVPADPAVDLPATSRRTTCIIMGDAKKYAGMTSTRLEHEMRAQERKANYNVRALAKTVSFL